MPTSVLGRAVAVELGLLGRALERERRARASGDGLCDLVEPAGADLALVLRRRVAGFLERELALLQPHVRGHPLGRIAAGELEHRLVEGVEAREGDELE